MLSIIYSSKDALTNESFGYVTFPDQKTAKKFLKKFDFGILKIKNHPLSVSTELKTVK